MEQLDQISSIIALTMGVAWASGINLYAAVLMLGLLGSSGNMVLPQNLEILMNPLVLSAAGAMYLIEFVADKVPGIDNSWDGLQTFIRIPAGAALAAGAIGEVNPAISLAVAILGGSLAAGTHATKAGSRVLINTSPEPVSNWIASLSEDILVIAGLWTALHYPLTFLACLAAFIIMMVWLLPKIWRSVKWIFRKLANLFSGHKQNPPPIPEFKLPDSFQSLSKKRSVGDSLKENK